MKTITEAVRVLTGMRLTEIRRVANIVIAVFRDGDGGGWTIHAQCPFRVMHGDVILLGSFDMHWPDERSMDRDEAFETLATKYDLRAHSLTSTFAEEHFRVKSAELGPGGLLVVEADGDAETIRLEAVPACSGPKIESWRFFELGNNDDHYVYPEAAGRD